MKYFWYYLIFINLFAFCTYGIDKWKAKKGAWRIRTIQTRISLISMEILKKNKEGSAIHARNNESGCIPADDI